MDHVFTRDGRLRLWTTFRDVTPEVLFSYWTEPAKLTRWWPEEATLEAVPGGAYCYRFPKGGHTLQGTFTEVVQGRRLAFSWKWQHEPLEQNVVVDLERRDEDTLLTVTHNGLTTSGVATSGVATGADGEGTKELEGWTHFLGRLKRCLEPA